jgi:hypothetical protein
MYAAWIVARSYNYSHLQHNQALWWHLSGAALTIWITRNWTSDQILSRAAELVKQHEMLHSGGVLNKRLLGGDGVEPSLD